MQQTTNAGLFTRQYDGSSPEKCAKCKPSRADKPKPPTPIRTHGQTRIPNRFPMTEPAGFFNINSFHHRFRMAGIESCLFFGVQPLAFNP